jgi:pimeloyl-ACP methyl ester carboxylesterase
VPSLTFKHDGLRLAYDVVGEGFPVILHTGAGGDSRMWRDAGYVDALGGYMVVLFDHRGHGASDAPTDPRGYLPEHHAADVVALADHLGLDRFAFWGYSAGARFGFQLAATRPDRLAGLIALGTVDAEDADPAEWLTDAESARVKGLEPILDGQSIPQWLRENLLSTDNEVLARGFECFADWSPWPPLRADHRAGPHRRGRARGRRLRASSREDRARSRRHPPGARSYRRLRTEPESSPARAPVSR